MRGLLSICMLLTAILAMTYAYRPPVHKPRPLQPDFPTFPGQGPFNPRPIQYPRFRRSPDDKKGKITIEGQKEGKKSSYKAEYEHKIYENKHGSIGINAGVNKNPYQKPEPHVGIGGKFNFG